MKRSILVLALLGVLALSTIAPALAQDEGLLIWADEERIEVMLEIGNAFEEEFGVPVTVEQMGQADGRDALLEFAAAGDFDRACIFGAHTPLGDVVMM